MVALLSFATQPALQLVTSETEVKEQNPTMFLMLAYFPIGLNAATLVVCQHPTNRPHHAYRRLPTYLFAEFVAKLHQKLLVNPAYATHVFR